VADRGICEPFVLHGLSLSAAYYSAICVPRGDSHCFNVLWIPSADPAVKSAETAIRDFPGVAVCRNNAYSSSSGHVEYADAAAANSCSPTPPGQRTEIIPESVEIEE
jgi:hypothetical protein